MIRVLRRKIKLPDRTQHHVPELVTLEDEINSEPRIKDFGQIRQQIINVQSVNVKLW